MQILIVEDEAILQEEISNYLQSRGHSCYTAGNYENAAALIKEQELDFIILDISLPDKSGIELLRTIKAN